MRPRSVHGEIIYIPNRGSGCSRRGIINTANSSPPPPGDRRVPGLGAVVEAKTSPEGVLLPVDRDLESERAAEGSATVGEGARAGATQPDTGAAMRGSLNYVIRKILEITGTIQWKVSNTGPANTNTNTNTDAANTRTRPDQDLEPGPDIWLPIPHPWVESLGQKKVSCPLPPPGKGGDGATTKQ